MNHLRYGARTLLRMRGAAVLAVATLALGIAVTTTTFSAAYAALLRPLPFPDRLLRYDIPLPSRRRMLAAIS